jgi:hypothetical protein
MKGRFLCWLCPFHGWTWLQHICLRLSFDMWDLATQTATLGPPTTPHPLSA